MPPGQIAYLLLSLLGLVIAFAFALPLFLFMRERHLARQPHA